MRCSRIWFLINTNKQLEGASQILRSSTRHSPPRVLKKLIFTRCINLNYYINHCSLVQAISQRNKHIIECLYRKLNILKQAHMYLVCPVSLRCHYWSHFWKESGLIDKLWTKCSIDSFILAVNILMEESVRTICVKSWRNLASNNWSQIIEDIIIVRVFTLWKT